MACASQQPKLRNKATTNEVYVKVIWADSLQEVDRLCKTRESLRGKPYLIKGCTIRDVETITIITIQPKDFNDHEALDTLGHEFWHSLGATHDN